MPYVEIPADLIEDIARPQGVKMEVYHKIHAPYKRHLSGPKKGKLILGDWSLPELEYLQNNQFEWTEKVDGTNIRVGLGLDEIKRPRVLFAGRSNNATIPDPLLRYLVDEFSPVDFERAGLTTEAVLYGEGYGPKIQGGGKYRGDHSFVLFDVKIGDWWLKREDVNDIARKLGIDSVPVIGEGTIHDAIDFVSGNVPVPFAAVETLPSPRDPMKSTWGDFTAEGLVLRPKVALFDRRGDRIITKVKVKDFV